MPTDRDLTATELDEYALSGEAGGEAVTGSGDPFFVSKKAAAVFKHKPGVAHYSRVALLVCKIQASVLVLAHLAASPWCRLCEIQQSIIYYYPYRRGSGPRLPSSDLPHFALPQLPRMWQWCRAGREG